MKLDPIRDDVDVHVREWGISIVLFLPMKTTSDNAISILDLPKQASVFGQNVSACP